MSMIKGYRRSNGKFGIRNHLLIIPTVICANHVANRIQQAVPDSVAIPHQHGCSQIGDDKERTHRLLGGMGKNPNVGAVLLISLGCEVIDAKVLKQEIEEETGKPVEWLDIQDAGGTIKAIQKGSELAKSLFKEIEKVPQVDVPISELILGVKCGGSDATSGLCSNPALGKTADQLLNQGGTIVMGETTEIIGAEHIVAQKAVSEEVANKLYAYVNKFEKEVERIGADMRGGNPSPGNIEGGLSTIEEKSLGCISKAGTAPLNDVLSFAEEIPGNGYYFMDSPGNDIECVSGMAAAGVHMVCFTTGRGTPTGNPIIPVIKITGNEHTAIKMIDNIDIDTSPVMKGKETTEEAGNRIFETVLKTAQGELTKAEILGHQEFSISRISISL
ncbi:MULTISPECIES: UxaA family hydrolase [Peribacillus]|uniref:Altronate dehydratase n=1 Tax=Peribacillus butanolivorans TaxID=421767 RepID=A0AAX0S464_9BACI|nr:UxaA family hydrolase [Peribacillus butanolivorans]AXN38169.1 altronate dehydratase [Peribacillus butanolivorans]PEJ34163.1 carbohydrate hydrolase [Peribacillus butanolivorans]